MLFACLYSWILPFASISRHLSAEFCFHSLCPSDPPFPVPHVVPACSNDPANDLCYTAHGTRWDQRETLRLRTSKNSCASSKHCWRPTLAPRTPSRLVAGLTAALLVVSHCPACRVPLPCLKIAATNVLTHMFSPNTIPQFAALHPLRRPRGQAARSRPGRRAPTRPPPPRPRPQASGYLGPSTRSQRPQLPPRFFSSLFLPSSPLPLHAAPSPPFSRDAATSHL